MSVVTRELLKDEIAQHFHTVRPGEPCFYCGDPLPEPPYVIWQGSDKDGNQIGLHPGCAQSLGACLVSDGAQAEGKIVSEG